MKRRRPPPADELVFFIDRSLGRNDVAQALRESGERVELHDSHFRPDAADEEWLPEVGRRGWVTLTKDERISRNRLQRLVVATSRARLLVLVSANLRGDEQGRAFALARQRIRRLVSREAPPFIAKVYRDGRVKLWRGAAALLAEAAGGGTAS